MNIKKMKSNCLFQAIKHRFKGSPIYRVIPNPDGHLHFVWWDCIDNTYKHFTWGDNPVELSKFYYFTIFDGSIENFYINDDWYKLKLII
jgi:hypothetical protein